VAAAAGRIKAAKPADPADARSVRRRIMPALYMI